MGSCCMQPASAHQLPYSNIWGLQCIPFLMCYQALSLHPLKCKEKDHLWLRYFCSYEKLQEDLNTSHSRGIVLYQDLLRFHCKANNFSVHLLGMHFVEHQPCSLSVLVHEGSPLGELHRCVRDGVKINVHIRTFKGLRGVCTGFLVAFDKFWNMVITIPSPSFIAATLKTWNLQQL